MDNDVFDVVSDYTSFEQDGIICDKGDIFCLLIAKYITEGRLIKDDYYTIGELYMAVTDYVNSTHVT